MGCGGSKEVAGEQPAPTDKPVATANTVAQTPSAEPVANGIVVATNHVIENDDEETGSDCLFISTDPGEETVNGLICFNGRMFMCTSVVVLCTTCDVICICMLPFDFEYTVTHPVQTSSCYYWRRKIKNRFLTKNRIVIIPLVPVSLYMKRHLFQHLEEYLEVHLPRIQGS